LSTMTQLSASPTTSTPCQKHLVNRGVTALSGELSYFYTDRNSASDLTAPNEAGEYDVRYVLEAPGGRQVIAKAPVRVR
jgi:Ca-activated chloride channel family protein